MARCALSQQYKEVAHSYILDPALVGAIIEQEHEPPDFNTVVEMCRRLARCLDASQGDEYDALKLYNPRGEYGFESKVLQAKIKYY